MRQDRGVAAALEIGLPWPWRFHKIAIRGDTCYFWATSPRTFALGFEDLRDGFVIFLGPLCVGWGSISAAMNRAAPKDSQEQAP